MTDGKEYGKALFMLTEECGTTERVVEDVKVARSAFLENSDYVRLLDTPVLPKNERVALADKAFLSLDENLVNLIKILAEAHNTHAFIKAADEYLSLYDDSRGILRVEAISAIALTHEQSAALAKKLEGQLHKTVIIKNVVDPAILGGMKLRYGDRQLDGSVKTRLDKFEEALKNTIV
ncbi:MAG: ATP synthase F1 subunit delta [Clostridia bacterium]|nr:ATP synthase F1 subunit delta [Clostridia bacterium]